MKRILLQKGVTTSDISKLADQGISTLEFDHHNEEQKRIFEYFAVCENECDIKIVGKLNKEISMREIKSHLLIS